MSDAGFKKWTDVDDEKIRTLHASGMSLSKMASEMGVTGGQMRGRVWKLKLVRKPKEAEAAE
jgi:hypothetical protein